MNAYGTSQCLSVFTDVWVGVWVSECVLLCVVLLCVCVSVDHESGSYLCMCLC